MKDAIISALTERTEPLGIQSVLTDGITVQTYIQKMNFLDSRDAIIMEQIWLRLSPIPGMLESKPSGVSIHKESPIATLLKKTALIMNADDTCESLWNAMEQSRYLNRSGIRRKAMHVYYSNRHTLEEREFSRIFDVNFDALASGVVAYFHVIKTSCKTYHKAPIYSDNIPNIETWNCYLKHGLRHLVSPEDEQLIYRDFIELVQTPQGQYNLRQSNIDRYIIDQTPLLYKEYIQWLFGKNKEYTHSEFLLGSSKDPDIVHLVFDMVFHKKPQLTIDETPLFLP